MPCNQCSDPNGCRVIRLDGHARCLFCNRDLGEIRDLPRADEATPDIDDTLSAWQREVQENLEGKAIAHMAAARMRGYRVPLDIFRRDLAKRFNAEDLAEFKRLAVAFWPARERS